MRELNLILDAWRADRQASGVLATVVHVEGSAYRRPGARMWISADGCKRIGTISGGCLEGDVAKKAAWWTSKGDPVVRVYDTMSDEDAVWEFGLGCNGVIHVLLERLESLGARLLLDTIEEAQRLRRELVIATVIRTVGGSAASPFRTGDHIFQFRSGELAAAARQTLVERRSRLVHAAHADLFFEYIAPPQRLVVFGAGHDAIPVVSLAASLGWDITVADVRSGYTKPDRFPGASRVVQLPASGDVQSLGIDRETAVILMTHNLLLDARLLPQLKRARPGYIGVLGPKKRMTRLMEEARIVDAAAMQGPFDAHSPAGLDLGGDAPEAIALSMVAEIQAHLHGRDAQSLRWSSGPIHEPVMESGTASPQLEQVESSPAVCEVTAFG